MTTNFYVGQELFFVPNKQFSPEVITVKKVGRKYAEFTYYQDTVRFDIKNMQVEADHRGVVRGNLYLTEQDFNERLHRLELIKSIREAEISELRTDVLEQIVNLLKIQGEIE